MTRGMTSQSGITGFVAPDSWPSAQIGRFCMFLRLSKRRRTIRAPNSAASGDGPMDDLTILYAGPALNSLDAPVRT